MVTQAKMAKTVTQGLRDHRARTDTPGRKVNRDITALPVRRARTG